jgi:hypothetical protein
MCVVRRVATHDPDDIEETGDVGFPQGVILMAAVADLAFTAAVAVHVAFYDVVGWTVVLIVVAALVFVAATIVALAAKRRAVVIAGVVFLALAGCGAVAAGVDDGLRYRALRRQRVDADGAHDRRIGGAMLCGASASVAALAALPLAGYLAYGILRADRVP